MEAPDPGLSLQLHIHEMNKWVFSVIGVDKLVESVVHAVLDLC